MGLWDHGFESKVALRMIKLEDDYYVSSIHYSTLLVVCLISLTLLLNHYHLFSLFLQSITLL